MSYDVVPLIVFNHDQASYDKYYAYFEFTEVALMTIFFTGKQITHPIKITCLPICIDLVV